MSDEKLKELLDEVNEVSWRLGTVQESNARDTGIATGELRTRLASALQRIREQLAIHYIPKEQVWEMLILMATSEYIRYYAEEGESDGPEFNKWPADRDDEALADAILERYSQKGQDETLWRSFDE